MHGMGEGAPKELGHVTIGELVVDVFAPATAHDEVLAAQDAKALTDRGHAVFTLLGEVTDAAAAVGEALEEPKAIGVGEGPKDRRGSFEGVPGKGRRGRIVPLLLATALVGCVV